MNIKTNDYFFSSDLGLASSLSLFYPLEFINKSIPQKAQFAFKKNTHLDELVQLYWRGELKGNLLAYFNQLKVIKSRLYEEK